MTEDQFEKAKKLRGDYRAAKMDLLAHESHISDGVQKDRLANRPEYLAAVLESETIIHKALLAEVERTKKEFGDYYPSKEESEVGNG